MWAATRLIHAALELDGGRFASKPDHVIAHNAVEFRNLLATSQSLAKRDPIEVRRHFSIGGVDEVSIDLDGKRTAVVGLPELFQSLERRLGIHAVALAVSSDEVFVGDVMRLYIHV